MLLDLDDIKTLVERLINIGYKRDTIVSKTTDITNNTVQNINHSWDNDQILMVICQNQDGSIAIDTVTIEKYELHMVFSVSGRGQNATLNSSIEGTGTASPEFSLSNYEYQWYRGRNKYSDIRNKKWM